MLGAYRMEPVAQGYLVPPEASAKTASRSCSEYKIAKYQIIAKVLGYILGARRKFAKPQKDISTYQKHFSHRNQRKNFQKAAEQG